MALPGGKALDAQAAQVDSSLEKKDAKRNEIKEIRNYKQIEKIELDFDSPRLKRAMYNLGVSKEECLKK